MNTEQKYNLTIKQKMIDYLLEKHPDARPYYGTDLMECFISSFIDGRRQWVLWYEHDVEGCEYPSTGLLTESKVFRGGK